MEEEVREKDIAYRVLRWFSEKTTLPYEVRLCPTNKCNLACLPCVARGRPLYDPKEEVEEREYVRVVREAAELGAQRFDICGGGEPFCRPKVTLSIMEEIKKHNLMGTISTNGTLLTRKMIEHLVKIGWDEMRFSINGSDAETDDYLRGVDGTFGRSIKAIKAFQFFKKKMNRKEPHILLTPIITTSNYNEVCEFVELAHELDVETLILQPFMSEVLPDSRVEKNTRMQLSRRLRLSKIQQEEFRNHLRHAKKIADNYKLNSNMDFLDEKTVKHTTDFLIQLDSKQSKNPMLSIPCFYPWWVLDINTSGGAGPCARAEFRVSTKGKKLTEIWHGDSFNAFRQTLARGEVPHICKSCCPISVIDNRRCRTVIAELLKTVK